MRTPQKISLLPIRKREAKCFLKGPGAPFGSCGPSHYPVTGSRVSILKMQILPSSLNISNAIYSKEIHQSTALIKTLATQSWGWRRVGGPLPAVPNARSARFQGSPGVHRPTYVIQSYSIFCVESQDRYYNAGIRLLTEQMTETCSVRKLLTPIFPPLPRYLALISPTPARRLPRLCIWPLGTKNRFQLSVSVVITIIILTNIIICEDASSLTKVQL